MIMDVEEREHEYWEESKKMTVKMAENISDAEAYTTLADIGSELTQWCIRASHDESLYKKSSVMELFTYLTKATIMMMVIDEKLSDHKELHQMIADTILEEYKTKYSKES